MRDEASSFDTNTAPSGASHPHQSQTAQTLTLRVMATTDLHMQLLGYDYVYDTQSAHNGLAGVAHLIEAARKEAHGNGYASVLLDNGDVFQGGPLAEMLAHRPVDPTHPMVATLNHLKYDAVGLGNHDLDYGTDYLAALGAALDMPQVASNLDLKQQSSLVKSALLQVQIPFDDTQTLGVGILSVLPENTGIWNASVLEGKGQVLPALATLRRQVPILRAKGADVIILLAHMGIRDDEIDSAVTLAQHTGADAVIAGHTHRRFPGDDHARSAQVDPHHGMLASCPAAMPGHGGSDLAVLDLRMTRTAAGRWNLGEHTSTLIPNQSTTKPSPAIATLSAPAHAAVQAEMAQYVCDTPIAFHNYFSLAMPTPTSALLAAAKAHAVRKAMQGRPAKDLPLIAATAAHTAGGIVGPDHYLNIPAGPVLRRHLAGLATYRDEIWGLEVTGATVRNWLERSAAIFHELAPNAPDQPLARKDLPPFSFDTIYGLSYQIDPTKPKGSRIFDLRHAGAPVGATQRFLIAASHFRASGGGGLLRREDCGATYRSGMRLEQALADVLRNPQLLKWADSKPWAFKPAPATSAVLETTPLAENVIADAAHLNPVILGETETGFARIRMAL